MSDTPESKVKTKVREVLRRHRIHYNHIPGSRFGKAGAADYVCCINGLYLAVEVKAKGGRQTELQKTEEESIRSAGGRYLLVNETNFKWFEDEIIRIKTESMK